MHHLEWDVVTNILSAAYKIVLTDSVNEADEWCCISRLMIHIQMGCSSCSRWVGPGWVKAGHGGLLRGAWGMYAHFQLILWYALRNACMFYHRIACTVRLSWQNMRNLFPSNLSNNLCTCLCKKHVLLYCRDCGAVHIGWRGSLLARNQEGILRSRKRVPSGARAELAALMHVYWFHNVRVTHYAQDKILPHKKLIMPCCTFEWRLDLQP